MVGVASHKCTGIVICKDGSGFIQATATDACALYIPTSYCKIFNTLATAMNY